jgi:hypothetical protein
MLQNVIKKAFKLKDTYTILKNKDKKIKGIKIKNQKAKQGRR